MAEDKEKKPTSDETKTKKPTFDELWKEFDRQESEAMKNIGSAVDKMIDAMNNCPPEKLVELGNALAKVDEKKSSGKKTLMERLQARLRGKKTVVILAVLGAMALASALGARGKQGQKTTTSKSDLPHDKAMAALNILTNDPQRAFAGLEFNTSMESDCIMMNTKVLDALDGALKKAGYLDKDGNLKKFTMVDISNADALDALSKGLRAPKIYPEKESTK